MTQLFANVSLANTFNTWRIRTNQLVDHINKSANTTGVSNLRSANLVATNITTLSGPVTISGNTTWSAKTKTISGSNTVISSNVTFTSTGAIKVPAGTTAQRSVHNSYGHFRYNTTINAFEGYTTSGWRAFVANATVSATYVTNTVFQSALANTNTRITTVDNARKANLANTNTYIATKVSTSTFNSVLANTNSYIAAAQTASAQLNSNNDYTSTNQFRIGAPVKTITANAYSLLAEDAGKYLRLAYANTSANPSSVGITLPKNSTTPIPIGSEYMFVRTGSNSAIVFANAAGVTLNSDGGKKRVLYQWNTAVCKKVATDEWDLLGSLNT